MFAPEFRLPILAAFSLIGVMLLCNPSAWAQPAETVPQDLETFPDLNQLQQDVLDFWSLMSQGKKFQALHYVAEGQDHFLNWKWPRVQSYRVTNLDLKNGADEVLVTTTATILPPGFEAALSWPVRQRWVFRDQAWRILVERPKLAALFGGTIPRPAKSGLDHTEILQEFRRFQIGKRRIHFGEALQGDVIWDEISYKNESAIEISVRVSEAPGWLALDRSHFVAKPGGEGTLLLGVFTEQLEGDIKGTVTLELAHGKASRTQTVPVLGSVRAPLALVPGRLVLVPGAIHEILVRNNGKEGIRITEILPPEDFITAEWATPESAPIEPGSRSILRVQWDAERIPEDWSGGVLRLVLDQPVGSRRELTIPILRRFP